MPSKTFKTNNRPPYHTKRSWTFLTLRFDLDYNFLFEDFWFYCDEGTLLKFQNKIL